MSKEIITNKELGEAIQVKQNASLFMKGLLRSLCSIEKRETLAKVSFLTFCDSYWQPSGGWALHGEGFDGEPPQVSESLELMPAFEVNISNCTGIGIGDVRSYLRCLNELIEKRLDECRDTKKKFNLFNLGILIADHGHMSFTSFTRLAKEDPMEYAKVLKVHAGDGFTREQGRGISALCPETCKILLKKCKSRLRRRRGGVSGRDTDPFCEIPRCGNTLIVGPAQGLA